MFTSPLIKQPLGYIAGRWVGADSGETAAVINPADGKLLARTPVMGADETTRAIEAAASANRASASASIEQRRQWLLTIADLLNQHRDEIGRIVTLEHGKPLDEAKGEVDYAAGFFRYFGEHVEALGDVTLNDRPRGCRWTVHYRPAGVVALITPWNFPIAMLAKKLAAALAADCTCVIKPASKTPLSVIALFTIMEKINLPAGKVNLVMGSASAIGKTCCEHPAVRMISFTGSTEVGQKLLKMSAPHVKRLSLELGGNAPFVVFDDADLDVAADQLMTNKFRGAGQTCVCANRVYVHRRVADTFVAKVVSRANQLTVGNGMDDGVTLGPLIDGDAFSKVKRHVDDAVANGASLIAGGVDHESTGDWGNYFPPTVLIDVTDEMACAREETFGPVAPVLTFDDEGDLIERCNATEFGLAAYVFTQGATRAARVIPQLHFGHVGWNTGTGPTPEAPFGGMKHSGFGREGGREGMFEFVEPQTVPALDS